VKRLVLSALAGILAIGAIAVGVVLSSTRSPEGLPEIPERASAGVAQPEKLLTPLSPLPPMAPPPAQPARDETGWGRDGQPATVAGRPGTPTENGTELPESWRSPSLPLQQRMPPRRPAR
jgi:hypothetical protein